jgi:hypothetical protein
VDVISPDYIYTIFFLSYGCTNTPGNRPYIISYSKPLLFGLFNPCFLSSGVSLPDIIPKSEDFLLERFTRDKGDGLLGIENWSYSFLSPVSQSSSPSSERVRE